MRLIGSAELGRARRAHTSLRARAPGLHDSTPLVRQLAAKVGRLLDLDGESRALLDMSVRARDVGMVALPDTVVFARKRPRTGDS